MAYYPHPFYIIIKQNEGKNWKKVHFWGEKNPPTTRLAMGLHIGLNNFYESHLRETYFRICTDGVGLLSMPALH